MCYETTARPPYPPIAGGAADGKRIVLRSSDGTELDAFEARSERPDAPGMVIVPDVRGLHPFYEDLAVRFAEAGVHAVAIDYFARTAGRGTRDDDFDFWPHVRATHPDTIAYDVAAAVGHLRDTFGCRAVFTVGFCFGGRNSFNQAARGHGLAGVVGFYGRVARADDEDANAPVDLAEHYACPVLGLFGGSDQAITADDVAAFGKTLEAAGVAHELHTYPGAPHSFFDRAFEQYRDECDDAWRRILGFVEANA